MSNKFSYIFGLAGSFLALAAFSGCSGTSVTNPPVSKPLIAASSSNVIQPGPDIQKRLQTALINAQPGDTIELAAGHFELHATLSLDVKHVTLRGQGSGKTILDFKKHQAGTGGEGLLVTAGPVTIESLAIEDAKGDALKIAGVNGVAVRGVRVEWTRGADSTNGSYGIYPVQCNDVLIEQCVACGASDAGIYVGQSKNIVVRNNHAYENVAGIEIENSLDADVYKNLVTNNTGGILVFSLPNLPAKNGSGCRVFENTVLENNHANFAPDGNIVAMVPPGTGLMVMAYDQVEVFDNKFENNATANVAVVSYHVTEKKFDDPRYDAFPESISIHHNEFVGGGEKPAGKMGTLLSPLVGGKFPDIIYDGIADSEKFVDGKLPDALRMVIHDNGDADFANMDLQNFDVAKLLFGKFPKISRDLTAHAGKHTALRAVQLPEFERSTVSPIAAPTGWPPKSLSAFNLFMGNGAAQEPVAGVVPYDLNTPLFSDYSEKYRFIRLPPGTKAAYHADEAFEFPIGTVIAKTFAYPRDMNDTARGRRLLETRILEHRPEGWIGLPYVWNDEQTEAVLEVAGDTVDVAWKHTDGSERKNNYLIPNSNQCKGCHRVEGNDQPMRPIGPTARQLNRDFAYADGTDNQLARWSRLGMLSDLPTADQWPHLAVWNDAKSGTVDQRARAWLEINCAHCHSTSGPAKNSGLDLRYTQTDPTMYGVFKSPVAAGKGTGNRLYDIVPGKPDQSILMYRIASDQPQVMMPELGKRMVHTEAVELIREWIAAMPEKAKGARIEQRGSSTGSVSPGLQTGKNLADN